jgi:glycosyltransferase involved in cell wall biosynthesis
VLVQRNEKNKIAIIVTTPLTAIVFLTHQINTLVEYYNVTIISNLNDHSFSFKNISEEVNVVSIPIERNVSLFADLRALFALIKIINKSRFTLLHSVSPKAGLLSAIAGWVSQTPIRLHTFTGQVWVKKKGIVRWFFKLIDKVIVSLNTDILIDSLSQKDFLIKQDIIRKNSSVVLGKGSISGVNVDRFKPSKNFRKIIRNQLNIEDKKIIFLFIGRLNRDKGLFELARSFKSICSDNDNLILLIVGPDEGLLKQELLEELSSIKEFVRFVSFADMPEKYMAASDILVLPSYREGFGSVIIEAAACGLPSIGSNIYGIKDAIKHNKTGLLSPVGSIEELAEAMSKLADNDKLRKEMGIHARNYATRFFSQTDLTSKILKYYEYLINR